MLARVGEKIEARLLDKNAGGGWSGTKQSGVRAGEICVYGRGNEIICYDASFNPRVIQTVAVGAGGRWAYNGPHRFAINGVMRSMGSDSIDP